MPEGNGLKNETSYNNIMPRRSKTETEPLLIDRAAAAELPSPEAVREWAGEKRAFISSVMSELVEERRAAAAGTRAVGVRPIMFEKFGGRDADPEEAYLSEVEGADIYIGILGRRYGKPLKSRFSATHVEYLHAERHTLRMAVWTLAAPDREGHEQSFLDEVRTFYVAPEFRTPGDLQRQVEERLRAIAAEDLSPWCKLGNVIFRASEVEDRGGEIHVMARLKSGCDYFGRLHLTLCFLTPPAPLQAISPEARLWTWRSALATHKASGGPDALPRNHLSQRILLDNSRPRYNVRHGSVFVEAPYQSGLLLFPSPFCPPCLLCSADSSNSCG